MTTGEAISAMEERDESDSFSHRRYVANGGREPARAPIGTLTLLVINELIRAAGVQSNFQAIVSGLLLYLFIMLQSIVMSLRDRIRFTIALPPWLPGKVQADTQ